MEEKDECTDHAKNPKGLGYSKDEPACKECGEKWPEYSADCYKVTAEREIPKVEKVAKVKKVKATYIETGNGHNFIKGTARGNVYELLSQGVEDSTIVQKLMGERGMTEKNAKRKVAAVKAITSTK
jgi:hypothetical protein